MEKFTLPHQHGENKNIENMHRELSEVHRFAAAAEILKQLGVEEVILGLDKEFESCKTPQEKAYATKIKKIFFDKLCNDFKVSVIWDKWNLLGYKNAPTDKGKETFLKLLSKRLYIN